MPPGEVSGSLSASLPSDSHLAVHAKCGGRTFQSVDQNDFSPNHTP